MDNEPTILIVPGLRDENAQQGSRVVDLGGVGHLNPASGYGEWPRAEALIEQWVTPAVSPNGGMVL